MKLVFLSFLSFVCSAALLVPEVSSLVIPPEWRLVLCFLVMVASMFIQVGVSVFLKSLKIAEERSAAAAAQAHARGEEAEILRKEAQDKETQLVRVQADNDALKAEVKRVEELKVALSATQKERDLLKNQPHSSTPTEVISLVSLFQEKGRLVDFLMQDIDKESDQDIGAAARIVHGGCRQVLKEYLPIKPLKAENEGSLIKIEEDENPANYRLIGQGPTKAPYTGRILHRGWTAEKINLPKISREGAFSVIAPTEVELA